MNLKKMKKKERRSGTLKSFKLMLQSFSVKLKNDVNDLLYKTKETFKVTKKDFKKFDL